MHTQSFAICEDDDGMLTTEEKALKQNSKTSTAAEKAAQDYAENFDKQQKDTIHELTVV